ncbi:MAG: reprolysin-like metallopeptidase [Saprospiraceae bacterium]
MRFILVLLTLCAVIRIDAQSGASFFSKINTAKWVESAEQGAFPVRFHAYDLQYESLRDHLAEAPTENSEAAKNGACVVLMPNAEGHLEAFKVWTVQVMDPELAAMFPDIRTYAGVSLERPGHILRVSALPGELRAIILRPDAEVEAIDMSPALGPDRVIAYQVKDLPVAGGPENRFVCGDDHNTPHDLGKELELLGEPPAADRSGVNPVSLRVLRWAVGCHANFTIDHGGTKASALAKVVDYTNRINAITERDAQLRFLLIPETINVIYEDLLSQPYSGSEAGNWMGQNTGILNVNIGAAKYDMGHCFARYLSGSAAGIAMLSSACGSNKGAGCSTANKNPATGDYGNYFIGVAAHEMGHQLSCGHTWNRCDGGGGRSGISAWEIGSGISVMSYSGLCGPDNVPSPGSNLFYHAGSVAQIYNHLSNVTCGTVEQTGNNHPSLVVDYPNNMFIPISTPFVLRCDATDPDGNALTYSWEQMDLGDELPIGQVAGNSPSMRCYNPATSNVRFFPRLATLNSNGSDFTEILPTYARELKFRVFVRDNEPVGGVNFADVNFRATANAGPFVVTSPNTSITWTSGAYVLVTWDVANTDKAPVNCDKVNIVMSNNGGATYNFVLAEGVPNIGYACVIAPDVSSPLCRIRVEAVNNVFFDISNVNFRVEKTSAPLFGGICVDDLDRQICLPETFSTNITTLGLNGYGDLVNLSILDAPAGANVSLSSTVVAAGQNASLTIDLPAGIAEGVYAVTVRAVSGGVTEDRVIRLKVVSNDFSALAVASPADGASGLGQGVTLTWIGAADADLYEVQLATNPSFAPGSVVAGAVQPGLSYTPPFLLNKGVVYYWRVRPINDCGSGPWIQTATFATEFNDCGVYQAFDLPKNIPASGTPTIESIIPVSAVGALSDVNVKAFVGQHQFFSDLEAFLISPDGTSVRLFRDRCSNYSGSFNLGFDDDSPIVFNNAACPPNQGAVLRPNQPLSAFNGKNPSGNWIMRVRDNVSSSGGALFEIAIELCFSATLSPPILKINQPLSLPSGTNALISPDLLLAEDANNTPSQLTYVLLTAPQHGILLRNDVGPLQAGDAFTQEDINQGGVRYFDYGTASGDAFRFALTDGEGGLVNGVFVITPIVGVKTPEAQRFSLSPNPSAGPVRLYFEQPLRSDSRVTLSDVSGRLLRQAHPAEGASTFDLDLSGMAAGLYFVQIENATGRFTQKVVLR